MKKLLLLAVSAAIVGFASCDKIKDMVKINVGVQSQNGEFKIDPIPGAGENELGAADVYLNIDSIIKTENSSVGVGNIKSAKVTEVTLEILNPSAENNFAVVENAKVSLASDTKPEVVTIAEITGNPDEYKTSMNIPLTGSVDLADYMSGSTFTYKLSAKTRRGTTEVINCKATVKYELVVGLE